MSKKLPYSWALITGASSGIGESLAYELAKSGISVILVARNESRLQSVAENTRKLGVSALPVVMDVTAVEAVEQITDFLNRHGIEIDLLINNAGFGSYGFFHTLPIQKEIEMIRLNIEALVRWTHHFLPGMLQRQHGAMINISSTAGFQPVPFMATYAATKAFVSSFTQALYAEYRNSGVFFLTVCPGRTHTRFQVISGSDRIRIRSRFATAEQVSRVTLRALRKKQLFVIEGWSNKFATHLQRFFPRKWILALTRRIFLPAPTGKNNRENDRI